MHAMYNIELVESIIRRYLVDESGMGVRVLKAMNEALLNGGKRIRPGIMLETYRVFAESNYDERHIGPFMVALEMIHTFSLIHDDLPSMDNDTMRRGKPTTWVSYGEAEAILAGDALSLRAFEVSAKAMLDAGKSPLSFSMARAILVLSQKSGTFGMLGGQVLDVEKTGQALKEDELYVIYTMKTSALLEAAFVIGGIIGGANDEEVKVLERVGLNVGLAFQIQDDILDEIADEKALGKNTHSDAKNHKTTYVSIYGIEKSKEKVKKLSKEAIALLSSLGRDAKRLEKIIIGLIDRTY